MAEIKWTSEAHRWLRDIHDYIARDNPKAAVNVISGIIAKAEILKRMPEIGQRYQRYPDLNVRILLYGHYRIAYLIQDKNLVYVLGVFHDALDIDRYLFN